ncbi:MAG: YaiI/YqxD family protein [Geminicoccaceae bacterium]
MLDLYIDADACPVKSEIYRVAERYDVKVFVVANNWMRVPDDPRIELVTVADGLDVADDWIAERAGKGDIVITADIPLAARCIKNGARAIGSTGKPFTEDSIGDVLATRNLMTELRETGEIQGGGRPFSKQDRSRFLQALDTAIQAIKRTGC